MIAVDVSPPMLARLRAKATAEGLTNIDAVEAGFLTYDHGPVAADFVYSRLALHHLPDFWKVRALRRINDMLAIGGVFRLWDVVYSFEPQQADDRLEAWCATGSRSRPFVRQRRSSDAGNSRTSDSVRHRWRPAAASSRSGKQVPPFTPVADGWGRWEVAEHVRDEHSTYSWLLEEMFRRTGFTIDQRRLPDDTSAKYVLRKN